MSDSQPAPTADAPASPAAPANPPASAAKHASRLSMIVLALLSVGLYLHVINYELVYDDHFVIDRNASMEAVSTNFTAIFDLFSQEYWAGVNPDSPEMLKVKGQGLYRPLSLFLWALIHPFHGATTTWAYHLLSILANALAVVLLYRAVVYLFENQRLAFVAALVFALHPLHSEAVAYVAGLHDVLSAAAVFLGLMLFVRPRNSNGGLSAGSHLGILAALFVGLLAKEQTILLLPVLMLTDGFMSVQGRGLRMSQRTLLYGGLLAVTALHVLMRYNAIGYLSPQDGAISILDNPLIFEDFQTRLINGLKLMAKATWLFLWPQDLASDYSFNAIPVSNSFLQPAPLAGLVLVASLLMLGLGRMKRWPALCWGILFFLGCTAFFSNIIAPIGTIFAERLTYLPTAGACVAVAALIDRFILSRGLKDDTMHPLALSVVVIMGLALAIRTVDRNAEFKNSLSLFEAAREVSPRSARVHFQLGGIEAKNELFTRAENSMLTSLSILPTFMVAKIALGDIYMKDENFDMAFDQYRLVLRDLAGATNVSPIIEDTKRLALQRLAEINKERGDLQGAEEQLKLLIQINPDNPQPYLDMADMLEKQDRAADAIPYLEDLLDRHPDNSDGLLMLARTAGLVRDGEAYARARQGLEQSESGRAMALCVTGQELYLAAREENDKDKLNRALAAFDEAMALDDSLPQPYFYRGRFLNEEGRPFDALGQLELALERDARHPGALMQKVLALFKLNTVENIEEAVETLSVLETVNPNAACYKLMYEAYFRLGRRGKMEQTLKRLEELGSLPIQTILQSMFASEDDGEYDLAIERVLEAMKIEGYADHPEVISHLARLLMKADRPAEALAALHRQAESIQLQPAFKDIYLSINKARALMALKRYVEAANELEQFEQASNADNPMHRASLLQWRSALFLIADGPFYRPADAAELCREGLQITGYNHPPFFDLLMEALLDQDDTEAALKQAIEARVQFHKADRYKTAELALDKATKGDVDAALVLLREGDDEVLLKLADALER